MSPLHPKLDWQPRFDPRSKNFPVRATLRSSIRRRNKLWKVGPILDQGYEGACVGFGWTAEALSTPVAVRLHWMRVEVPRDPDKFARLVYRNAQRIDEWAGEDYEGTSVLAGAKAMKQFGLLREYRWAFNIEQVADAVLSKGPVVIGIPWYEGMYEAPNGVLRRSGALVGGHCLLVVGYHVADPELGGEDGFVLQNSWGASWGKNGLAKIKKSELAELLADDGEACVPVSRSYGIYKGLGLPRIPL
jgi:hypothetical protein